MITLALDTSDARGSVALRKDGQLLFSCQHESSEDYSSWLLPAVQCVLAKSTVRMELLDIVAAATGPGSFTGLRIGLTAVKAWAEVYRKPIVGVSRLEAIAHLAQAGSGYVAASYDAHRGQLFAALYRASAGQLLRIEEELVIAPEEFLVFVGKHCAGAAVNWVSLDPELLTTLGAWQECAQRGESILSCQPHLAGMIGKIAEQRAIAHQFTDVLELDANYVRRSDAEIFWKETGSHVR